MKKSRIAIVIAIISTGIGAHLRKFRAGWSAARLVRVSSDVVMTTVLGPPVTGGSSGQPETCVSDIGLQKELDSPPAGDFRMADMGNLLTIGDFSRMSFLSVKTLRHYHDIGLLNPMDIDPFTGYRRYSTDQLPDAQVILRLRGFGMPLEEIRQVLQAPEVAARNAAIVGHLERMEQRLAETRSAVRSLRRLLEEGESPLVVEHRRVASTWSLAITSELSLGELGPWLPNARRELADALAATGLERTGPDGSLYFTELFTEGGFRELGDVSTSAIIAYLPVDRRPDEQLARAGLTGRVTSYQLPAADLAVTVHHGSCTELDRSYAKLGGYVTERAIGVAGPIREHHPDPVGTPDSSLRTEVGWPVFPISS
jgi:DNA-binding transcriptional MerR regulator